MEKFDGIKTDTSIDKAGASDALNLKYFKGGSAIGPLEGCDVQLTLENDTSSGLVYGFTTPGATTPVGATIAVAGASGKIEGLAQFVPGSRKAFDVGGGAGGEGYEDVTENGIPVYTEKDFANDAVNGYSTLRWLDGSDGTMGAVFYNFGAQLTADSIFIDSNGYVACVGNVAGGTVKVRRVKNDGTLISTSAAITPSATYINTDSFDYHPDLDSILIPTNGSAASAGISAVDKDGVVTTHTINLAVHGTSAKITSVCAAPSSQILFVANGTGGGPLNVVLGLYSVALGQLMWTYIVHYSGSGQTMDFEDDEPTSIAITEEARCYISGPSRQATPQQSVHRVSLSTGARQTTRVDFGPNFFASAPIKNGVALNGGDVAFSWTDSGAGVPQHLFVLNNDLTTAASLNLNTSYSIANGQILNISADETKIYVADFLSAGGQSAIHCFNYSLVEQWSVADYLVAQGLDLQLSILPRYPTAMYQRLIFPKILDTLGG